MLRDRFRELFASRRRKRPKNARGGDPGILPPIESPKPPSAAVVHIHSLREMGVPKDRGKSVDIFDYLLGFLIIGLLVLGGTLWTSRNAKSTESEDHWLLSPPSWMRSNPSDESVSPARAPSLPALSVTPKTEATPQRSGGEDLPVAQVPPTPTRIVPADYTEEARNAGFHGKVFVTVFVDALGVPEKMEPTSPIPFGLERTIRPAILQWRFEPALTRRRVAVASKTVVEVPFR